jgi:hypothetical protein
MRRLFHFSLLLLWALFMYREFYFPCEAPISDYFWFALAGFILTLLSSFRSRRHRHLPVDTAPPTDYSEIS